MSPTQITLLLACSSLLLPDVLAQQPESSVPANSSGVPTAIAYGDHTTGAALASVTALDIYTWQGQVGDEVLFGLRTSTNNIDPVVTVLAPNGATFDVLSASSDQFNLVSIGKTLLLDQTGTWTLLMQDAGNNNAGGYTIQLERRPPVIPPPHIVNGVKYVESISPTTDVDHLILNANAGSKVNIAVKTLTNNLDLLLEVFDPSGDLFTTNSCSADQFNTCSFAFVFEPLLSGEYLLRWRDNGLDNTGSFEITTTCFFGSCAATPGGLSADKSTVSASVGGVQTLTLDAGPDHAGEFYYLVGTTTGISPGFDIGGRHVALNIDGPSGYFMYTFLYPNCPPLSNSIGFLDGAGRATASFTVPAGTSPAFVGKSFHHAFVTLDLAQPVLTLAYSSNPVAVTIGA